MSSENERYDRTPPKRLINKKQGLRLLIHAAIRLIFAGEDPLAIHILIQSAEKVEIDLLAKEGKTDLLPIERYVIPSKKKEFYRIWRESYNFLKHADKDHDENLPIYDIIRTNDILLLVCANRYTILFGEATEHMMLFLKFAIACYPHLLQWPSIEIEQRFLAARTEFEHIPRGELLEILTNIAIQNVGYLRERSDDLVDVMEANQKPISGGQPNQTFEA